jgi:TRAP-type C4-dicarboxylate transport system substrate-binding protein
MNNIKIKVFSIITVPFLLKYTKQCRAVFQGVSIYKIYKKSYHSRCDVPILNFWDHGQVTITVSHYKHQYMD